MATGRTPPRFVPTLTEVVHSGSAPVAPISGFSQEQLAQRVLQRVDLVLERRVREAIATIVLEQTSLLTPMLRERLEAVVREIVADALADELDPGGPKRGP
jgi:hypothetical protein